MVPTPDPWANVRAVRDESVADPRAETTGGRFQRHSPRETPDGVLNVAADEPPEPPASFRWPVRSVRLPSHLAAYMREQAAIEGCSQNAWVVRLVQAHRDSGLPADVRNWLMIQAAQCGHPGEPDVALVAVLRHLADLWPNGARLRP